MKNFVKNKLKYLWNLNPTKKLQYLAWIFLILFYVLAYFKIVSLLYLLIGFSLLLDIFFLIHRHEILENVHRYLDRRTSIKKLDFYFIKDSDKIIDKAERVVNKRLLINIISSFYVPLFFTTMLFLYVFLNNHIMVIMISWLFILTVIPLAFSSFLLYLLIMIYKYPTICYTGIPAVSGIIYSISYSAIPIGNVKRLLDSFVFFELLLYLIITIVIYILFSRLPLYILRKIRANTIFVSAIVTVIITLLPQLLSQLVDYVMVSYNSSLTLEVISQANISPELKHILSQSYVIDAANFILKQEMLSGISGYTSYIVAGLTFSVLIGGLIISAKLSRKERFAQEKFREVLLNDNFDYSLLKIASYFGGDGIENLIISNKDLLDIIKQNEEDIEGDSKLLKNNVRQYLRAAKKELK